MSYLNKYFDNSIGSQTWNYDRPTEQPTDKRTAGLIGKFRFQKPFPHFKMTGERTFFVKSKIHKMWGLGRKTKLVVTLYTSGVYSNPAVCRLASHALLCYYDRQTNWPTNGQTGSWGSYTSNNPISFASGDVNSWVFARSARSLWMGRLQLVIRYLHITAW